MIVVVGESAGAVGTVVVAAAVAAVAVTASVVNVAGFAGVGFGLGAVVANAFLSAAATLLLVEMWVQDKLSGQRQP